MTTIVDETNRLCGVITDGDLRRLLEKSGDDLLSRPAEAVMSKHPKTIHRTALAAEAVELMERHAITVLIVIDAEQRVEGVVHLHDLLKAGVV